MARKSFYYIAVQTNDGMSLVTKIDNKSRQCFLGHRAETIDTSFISGNKYCRRIDVQFYSGSCYKVLH